LADDEPSSASFHEIVLQSEEEILSRKPSVFKRGAADVVANVAVRQLASILDEPSVGGAPPAEGSKLAIWMGALESLYLTGGATSRRALDKATSVVRESSANQLLMAALIGSIGRCHLNCGDLDGVRDCIRESSAILDALDPENLDTVEAKCIAQELAKLASDARDDELRDHNLARAGDDPLEEMLLESEWQRLSADPAGAQKLIERVIGIETPDGTVEALEAALRTADRVRDRGSLLLGWMFVAQSYRRSNPEESSEALDQARRLAERDDRLKGPLGLIDLQRARLAFDQADDAAVRGLLPGAARNLLAQRLNISDPVLRAAASIDDDAWSDLLLSLLLTHGEVSDLVSVLEGLASHGLSEVLLADPASLRDRAFESTEPVEEVRSRFRATWTPSWFDAVSFQRALPRDIAAIQATTLPAMSESDGLVGASTMLASGGALLARGFSLGGRATAALCDGWDIKSAVRFRSSDWQQLAGALLPDNWGANNLPQQVLCVPQGSIARVPFAALELPGLGALGDHTRVTIAPSLSVWASLPEGVRLEGSDVLVVGADTEELVGSNAGVGGLLVLIDGLRRLGLSVSRAQSIGELRRLAPPADAVILAVHGTDDSDRNGLEFPDGTHVTSVDLAAIAWPSIVISTSCWSGGLIASASPLTFVPALLMGGAQALVVSLWDGLVEASNDVTLGLLRHLAAGLTLGEALSEAQRAPAVLRHGVHRWTLAAVAR
jgi:hypothetical protein